MRPLPHSLDAERSALGSVFIRSSALDDLSDLAVEDFMLPAHQEILSAIRRVVAKGKPIDVVTVPEELKAAGVLDRLEGGARYLNDIADSTPASANARHYARIVSTMAVRRRLIATCAAISEQAYDAESDVEDVLAEARGKLAGIEIADGTKPTWIGDEMAAVIDSIEHRGEKPEDHFVRTGIASFDAKVTGLRASNLVVIAARPGKGKSSFARNILVNAAKRKVPVLLFSFEMSKGENIEMLIASEGRVDGGHIVSGRLLDGEWPSVMGAAGRLAALPIWLRTGSMTGPRICSETRRWVAEQRRKNPDQICIVAVDYTGLVKSTGDEDNREREVAAISSSLKQLAEELHIPVVAISQLNRESEKANREPRLSDLRESGSIEQDANMVLFPHIDESSKREGGDFDAKIIIAKNRSGAVGFVWTRWEPQFVTFSDTSDDGQQEAFA